MGISEIEMASLMMRCVALTLASLMAPILGNEMIGGTGTNGVVTNRCCRTPVHCDYVSGATTLDKAQCCPSGGEVTLIHDINSDVFTCDCGVAQTDCRTGGAIDEMTHHSTIGPGMGHYSTMYLNSQYNLRDSR